MRWLVSVCLVACGGGASVAPPPPPPRDVAAVPAASAPWVVRGNACPLLVTGHDAVASRFPGCGTPPLDLGFTVCPREGCPPPCGRYEVEATGTQRRIDFSDDVIGGPPPLAVSYDERGRPRSMTRRKLASELAYDADGRLASEEVTTEGLSLRRRYIYDGDRVVAVDAHSSRTSYTYDDRGRVIRVVVDAPHHAPVEWVLRYDGDRLLERGLADGSGPRTVFDYDCSATRTGL